MKRLTIVLLAVGLAGVVLLTGCIGTPPPEGAAPPAEEVAPPTEEAAPPEPALAPTPEVTYTLSVTANPPSGGSISLNPAGGTYEAGTEVTLTATPAQGYVFDYWSVVGEVGPSEPEFILTMNRSEGVTAHFKAFWSDGRIGIILDEVQRLDAMPPEFGDSPFPIASYDPSDENRCFVELGGGPPPREGYDYVALYLTVAQIKVEYTGYFLGANPSILIDAEGEEYQEKAFRLRGVNFRDLTHLTRSYELIEGTTMVLIFELPEQAKPKTLSFIYPFEEKSIMDSGKLDITITKVK